MAAPVKPAGTPAPARSPPPQPEWAALTDGLAVVLALAAASLIRSIDALQPLWDALGTDLRQGLATWNRNETALVLYQLLTILPMLFVLGQYRLVRDPRARWSFARVVAAVVGSFGALFLILFVLRVQSIPRGTIILDFVLLCGLMAGWRHLWARRVQRRHRQGLSMRNVLFVGDGELERRIARRVVRDPLSGRRIVGFFCIDACSLDPWPEDVARFVPPGTENGEMALEDAIRFNAHEHPRHLVARLGGTTEEGLQHALDGLGVEEVWVGPDADRRLLTIVLAFSQQRGVDVHLIPVQHGNLGIEPRPWRLGRFTLLDVHSRPISRLGWLLKRAMDIAGGLVGLAIASPVILVTAIAIKIEDPRLPVFYPGRRVGFKGRIFRMAKFTTMRRDAQELEKGMQKENQREGPWFKLEAENDPRLTRVGRVIRKFSINEIPQFWNVLKGDMSLVGPRPPIPDEVAEYARYDMRYFRCLDVKPGITGLWQVTAKNDPSFDRRIALDVQYIEHWSVWLDIKIMFRTLWTVVREPEE